MTTETLTWNRITDTISDRDAILSHVATGDRVSFRIVGDMGCIHSVTGRALVTTDDVLVDGISLLDRSVIDIGVTLTANELERGHGGPYSPVDDGIVHEYAPIPNNWNRDSYFCTQEQRAALVSSIRPWDKVTLTFVFEHGLKEVTGHMKPNRCVKGYPVDHPQVVHIHVRRGIPWWEFGKRMKHWYKRVWLLQDMGV